MQRHVSKRARVWQGLNMPYMLQLAMFCQCLLVVHWLCTSFGKWHYDESTIHIKHKVILTILYARHWCSSNAIKILMSISYLLKLAEHCSKYDNNLNAKQQFTCCLSWRFLPFLKKRHPFICIYSTVPLSYKSRNFLDKCSLYWQYKYMINWSTWLVIVPLKCCKFNASQRISIQYCKRQNLRGGDSYLKGGDYDLASECGDLTTTPMGACSKLMCETYMVFSLQTNPVRICMASLS